MITVSSLILYLVNENYPAMAHFSHYLKMSALQSFTLYSIVFSTRQNTTTTPPTQCMHMTSLQMFISTQKITKGKLPVIFIATLGRWPITLSFGNRGSSVMRHLSNWIVKLVGCSKCIGVTVFLAKASSHFSSPVATRIYTTYKEKNHVVLELSLALKLALTTLPA